MSERTTAAPQQQLSPTASAATLTNKTTASDLSNPIALNVQTPSSPPKKPSIKSSLSLDFKRFRSKTSDAKHESNQTTASNASLSILTNPLPLAQSPTISECEDGEDGEDRNHQVKRRNNLLSEFKRMDVQCRQQRLLLNQLKDHQRKLIMDGLLFTRRNQRSAAGDSAVSTATGSTGSLAVISGGSRIRTRELDLPFKRSYPPNRVSRLFAGKPKLKFSAQVLLHRLKLAVIDGEAERAEYYLSELPRSFIRKRYPFQANLIFLYAISRRMEKLVLLMLDKGFPKDCNQPIMTMRTRAKYAGNIPFQINSLLFPSYFMTAIAFQLETTVKFMIKLGANVNQNWCGLTPLHLTLFSAGGSANHSLLATLLEFGADPWQALPFSSLALLHRLRAAVFPTGDPSASSQSSRLLMQHPQSAVAAYRDFMPANQKPGTLNDTCLSWSLFKLVLPLAVAVGNKDRVAVAQLLLRMQPAVNKRFSKKHHSGGSSAKGSSSSLGWLSTEKLTPSAAFTATDDDIPRCKLSLLLCPLVGDPEMAVHLLKSRCVHLLPTNPCGANALHLAIRAGDSQLARILLYFDTVDGDLMNMRGEGGWTALHEAISQRQLDLFRIMLRKGADASVRNDAGDTPRELGLKMGVNLNDLDCIWFGNQMQEQSQQLMAASLSALTAQPSQSLDRLFATIEPHLMRLITEPTDEWLRSLQRIAYPTTNSQTMPASPNSVMKSHSADQRSRLFMMESMETTASADSPQFYTPTETANPGDLPPFASGAVVAATVAKRQGTLRPKVFSKMFSRRKRLSLDGALDMRQTPAQQTPSAIPFDMQQRVDKPSIIITSPPLPPNDLNE